MLAVGIDVSKSKSTAAILKSDGTILAKPFTFRHNQPEMNALVKFLKNQNEPLVILMEYTGHYHYPVLKKLEEEGCFTHRHICLGKSLSTCSSYTFR